MPVPTGIWQRLRTWTWKEWSAVSVLTVLSALAYARLAWTEGIGMWTTRYGDSQLIGMNPFFWWPEMVTGVAPLEEGSILVYGAYWLLLGLLTSWLAITAFRFVQRRLRGPTPGATS